MKKLFVSFPVCITVLLFSFSQIGLTSCEKETEFVHDTVIIIRKDTVTLTDTLVFKDTVSITLQPCNNPYETNIASLWQGNNNDLQELPVFYWTYFGEIYENRSILKFDLSAIPSNRTIIDARLSLHAVPNPVNGDKINAHAGSNNAVLIQRITSAWDTTTLSWDNQPSSTSINQIELAQTSEGFKNYGNLDISNLIKDIYREGNNGIMLKLKNRELHNIQNFASSKHAQQHVRPKLIITYTKP